MTLLSHLEELRLRLLYSIVAVLIAAVIGFFLAPRVLALLIAPIESLNTQLTATDELRIEVMPDGTLRAPDFHEYLKRHERIARIGFYEPGGKTALASMGERQTGVFYRRPTDPLMLTLQTALALGVLLSLPVVLFQAWQFVAPGLLPGERRLVLPFVFAGCALFLVGVLFAYFTLDIALRFFADFVQPGASYMNDMGAYLSFTLTCLLAFGVLFELPLVTLLATRAGLVSVEFLAARRRVIFAAILVIAAAVTPSQDPITLGLMAGPLYLLFELSLLISRAMEPRQPAYPGPESDREGTSNP